jgi:RND superfamily putative drug exporter
VLAAWTRYVLRFRWLVLAFWALVIVAGFAASRNLDAHLENTFTVPGTDSERARTILQDHFGDRSDGEFLIVFRAPPTVPLAALGPAMRRAAAAVPTGRAGPLRRVGDVVYGSVTTTLVLARAKGYTDRILGSLHPPPRVHPYVSGQAAIQHELDPVFKQDLRKGESIALPIALVVLLLVFGISAVVTMPFVFAAATIFGTLGLVWAAAHELTMATYATNLVQLIGLGIAVDYSLLVVYRFREELQHVEETDDAVVRTMATAGRAVFFSGVTVAIGLALLLFMPLPFMRSLGVAGFLIPVVSLAAAMTLQPALLSVYGRRGTKRIPLLPERFRVEHETGFWHRLAGSIMRRPLVFGAAGAAVLVAAAVPAYALHLTPGSARGIPRFPQSVRGYDLLTAAVGPGALSPSQIVVDTGSDGGTRRPGVRAAVARLVLGLERDPEVAYVSAGSGPHFVDPSARYEQVVVAGKHEYGSEEAQRFVARLRGAIVPGARFPAGVAVLAGGGPPQGVDFLHQAYRWFPWLVGVVLVLTYLLLMRAFRSLLLPLKAVVLNLLSVAAAYGMLVVMFRWGVGKDLFGLYQDPQVEGWIPIFLFAMLFGLSMDYEVFLVTRMREAWDGIGENREAVAHGLERTGRIVTAAAIVMVAAFSGFVAGRIVGLQQFGLGLAVAIFLDATIVRAVLVPSLMAVFGRWNWWLPGPVARVVRVQPSPLEGARPALEPSASSGRAARRGTSHRRSAAPHPSRRGAGARGRR